MAAALGNAFFLDDPQDGVSYHLLTEIGVDIHRAVDIGRVSETRREAFAAGLAEPGDVAVAAPVLQSLLAAEHSFEVPTAVRASGGSIAVDVRDSADAWLRLVLEEGDGASFAAGVNWRLVAPGSFILRMPDFAEDCDRHSKQTTVRFARRAPEIPRAAYGRATLLTAGSAPALPSLKQRFVPGSEEEAAANVPHFHRPGTPHTRDVVTELCAAFYELGWVTGTGGSISIRHGGRIFMAPSSVQKERMQPQDIYVLDSSGAQLYAPAPLPGRRQLSLSQCAPLFQHAFNLRKAGACIHTHDVNAVMATLQSGPEWRITHQEMIKGVAGHGFLDECVVPVIENTPHECDLADSLEEAMVRYPKSNAVLVRRHGVYVWGASWEAAKTQAECYHYLFDVSVRMRALGIDPGAVPARVEDGIGAATSYGTARAGGPAAAAAAVGGAGAGAARPALPAPTPATPAAAPTSGAAAAPCSCCSGSGSGSAADHSAAAPAPAAAAAPAAPAAVAAASGDGFHGSAGLAALNTASAAASAAASVAPVPLNWSTVKALVLDIEGTTTPISFVSDVLFPYAADHLEEHVRRCWAAGGAAARELAADVAALAELSAADVAQGAMGATAVAVPADAAAAVLDASAPAARKDAVVRAIVANVGAQMAVNRKTAALKQLQAHIWREGYALGELKGQVFPDTPAALRAWVDSGRKVYIYSSGSREAQRLLFASVAGFGDLRPLLSGFFDIPSAGPKTEAASYSSIAASLGVDEPSHILFATDALVEARAAAAAGMQVIVTDRPGNAPLPEGHGFPVVATLTVVAAKAAAAAAAPAAPAASSVGSAV